MVMIRIKKDKISPARKGRVEKNLRQIIDEQTASEIPHSLQLRRARVREGDPARLTNKITEAALFKPPQSRLAQFVRRSGRGLTGFVTDDAGWDGAAGAFTEELEDPRIRGGKGEPRPVNKSLQLGPGLVVQFLQNGLLDSRFSRRNCLIDPATFHRGAMKSLVVANDGVVQIDCHPAGHRFHESRDSVIRRASD